MFYHWLAPLGQTHIIFNLFNYISFRAAGATVTALLLAFLVGPPVIRRLRAQEGGPGDPRGRAREPPEQAGHADDGRPHHPARHHRADAALGAAHQPVRGRGDAVHPVDGVHRLPRRLPQDRAGEVARAGGQVEAGGAGELRRPAGTVSGLQSGGPLRYHSRHGHDAAVLQVPRRQLRAAAVRALRDGGDHREQQRREPHRRARRARHRAWPASPRPRSPCSPICSGGPT